jgi:hypothetical protein
MGQHRPCDGRARGARTGRRLAPPPSSRTGPATGCGRARDGRGSGLDQGSGNGAPAGVASAQRTGRHGSSGARARTPSPPPRACAAPPLRPQPRPRPRRAAGDPRCGPRRRAGETPQRRRRRRAGVRPALAVGTKRVVPGPRRRRVGGVKSFFATCALLWARSISRWRSHRGACVVLRADSGNEGKGTARSRLPGRLSDVSLAEREVRRSRARSTRSGRPNHLYATKRAPRPSRRPGLRSYE